ncbi:Versicolorin reductase 1 [Sparassis crispa]|uniref:Versicolorin reductase 1 n=1 Tax=Sparassis crispa TaxID=139825 RepID=A0A401H280_9APHY|nr:Versicolorin reductase 1 [Sparassis crispa]GBE88556.1 Versicolorin reductase 1 [Sparassis crispa]
MSQELSPVKPSLGRTAFVTGGGQGIGRAIALRLARDGYDISIADIPPAKEKVDAVIKEIEAYGRKAVSVYADVRVPTQIEAAIAETIEKLGPTLFVSVANAGVTQVKPLLECTPEFIENEVRINLLGLMNTHIFAAKQMVKQGFGGRIIGAGSIASYRTAENLGPYGATKFAVRGFTEASAKEWAEYGIRVNAYAPGIVDTPMWDHIDRELARIENISLGEAKARRVKESVKLGRIQEPEDVAKLVSFLASEEAEYITGQTIKTCGGASL